MQIWADYLISFATLLALLVLVFLLRRFLTAVGAVPVEHVDDDNRESHVTERSRRRQRGQIAGVALPVIL
ncbi:hypothetical protein WAI453_003558 [Rhynchosporium graminicola]